jgi:hypothetical protein
VTAVDASEGAINGVPGTRLQGRRVADMDGLPSDLRPFDAIICMGNTLGIGRGPESLPERLATLWHLTTPTGRLLAVTRDALATEDPDHLQYHARNRAAGRPRV